MNTTHSHPDDGAIDPETIRSREAVVSTTEQHDHDSRDHCSTGTVGRAVVDVTNEAGEHLLLVSDEHGVALLPNETVEADEKWLTVASETVDDQTGITADIEAVLAVRTVEHVVDEEEPHLTTHRIVFDATATGGEIQACKRTAENGSGEFRAGWFDELPDGIETLPNGPANDFELVME